MKETLSKKSLIKKTIQVGGNTLISRFLGLAREILLMRFLGVGVVHDAFVTAFLIPNSLRKIFAEGALTAAFVPTFIQVYQQEGQKRANALMTLGFLIFEGAVLALCISIMIFPKIAIYAIASGFSEAQIQATIPCLRILMPFIFFLSTSSLFTGALHSADHFFIPAFSPIILNIFFIGGLITCLTGGYSVDYLCFFIMAGGFAQFLLHVVAYFSLQFSFSKPTQETYRAFGKVLLKFLPCFLSMSVMEINLMIDHNFASFLPIGSVTLIKYGSRFMGIPLGVFAAALSTILLPHFTRVSMQTPEKLQFYLYECTKLVVWVMLPAALVMCFLSEDIFLTLFASSSNKFPAHLVPEAGQVLAGYLMGLLFLSLNKILLSLYYALHDTTYPMYIALIGTGSNAILNFILVHLMGIQGLPIATSLAAGIQTILSYIFLHYAHKLTIPLKELFNFTGRCIVQLIFIFIPFYGLYTYTCHIMNGFFTDGWWHFFMIKSFGYWLWAGPLMLLYFIGLYITKRWFGIESYFLS